MAREVLVTLGFVVIELAHFAELEFGTLLLLLVRRTRFGIRAWNRL